MKGNERRKEKEMEGERVKQTDRQRGTYRQIERE